MGQPDAIQWELRQHFEQRFERAPAFLVRAPGRVNLIGEHTDYSEGLVLPFAVSQELWLAAAPRNDGRFRLWSREAERGDEPVEFEGSALRRRGDWLDYPQGIVSALRERGVEAAGLDLAICSELPRESGLSSSAALGVAVGLAVCHAQGLGWTAREVAELAYRGENHFVGTPCGILDPFAVALAEPGCALRIDCRSREVEPIPVRARFLVASSGVGRALAPGRDEASAVDAAASGYRDRVEQCRRAFEQAHGAGIPGPGARTLRDLAPEDLPRLEGALDPLVFRRARHVITENGRVDALCGELRRGGQADPDRVGAILREGQRSLRDDFEVSTPELDHLCVEADRLAGVIGSRLTGAGFGGSTLHWVSEGSAADVASQLADAFEARFARRPAILESSANRGASVEAL